VKYSASILYTIADHHGHCKCQHFQLFLRLDEKEYGINCSNAIVKTRTAAEATITITITTTPIKFASVFAQLKQK